MQKVFIIAEAGVNHNGSVNLAKKMVAAAASAGADAVKFQSFCAEEMVSINAPKAGYQKITTGDGQSHFEMIKNLELDTNAHRQLYAYCQKRKVVFLSSPFDLKSVALLNRLGLKIFKIPSGEITNLPLLCKIGSLRKKVILSTGMASLNEIKEAIGILRKSGTKSKDITILHSNTEYPTPFEDANLLAMLKIKDQFNLRVGYSDHTPGIEAAIAAVALGAVVIEKHFTLDKDMLGPDHKASLDSAELKALVKAVRNVEKALGLPLKKATPSELPNLMIVRKSIVAARDISKGETFDEKNLAVKRPGMGISPMNWERILGRKAKRDFLKDEMIGV